MIPLKNYLKMKKAKDIYEKETGNIEPTDQIAYHEWYIKYVAWLEKKVELEYRYR